MKKLKKLCLNFILLGLSCVVALVLCEGVSRLILNPADYLSQDLVHDEILGAVLSPHGGGYDDWGFRNKKVPSSADTVAIGDSHTFGNTAKMEESWPYVLGKLSGKTVYNMGLGGYGPNQYYHLLKTKALALKPKTIVCGLYMGDDFENAYLITYGLDYWAYLRELPKGNVNFDIWEKSKDPTWHKRFRIWLSRHSVVYKLVFHGPLIGRLKGNIQIENASRLYDSATSLIMPEKNIREAFLPKGILRRLDQENESVREGMRITFRLLDEMNRICRSNNVEFLVAVIPTKETVFAEYLEHRPGIQLGRVIDELLANERKARASTFQFFKQSNISYVDTLPTLKESVERELYARTAADMHPGKNGYRVIADSVSKALSSQ